MRAAYPRSRPALLPQWSAARSAVAGSDDGDELAHALDPSVRVEFDALGERCGPGDVVALGQVHAELAQQLERRGVLNALRDRLQAEPARQRDDRLDDMELAGFVARSPTNSMSIIGEEPAG